MSIHLLFIDSLHYFTCHTGAIDIRELKATYLLTYLLISQSLSEFGNCPVHLSYCSKQLYLVIYPTHFVDIR